MMQKLLYAALAALAVLGYEMLYRHKLRSHPAFFPIWLISGSTVAVYLFALAGLLQPGVWAICGGVTLSLLVHRRHPAAPLPRAVPSGAAAAGVPLRCLCRGVGVRHDPGRGAVPLR